MPAFNTADDIRLGSLSVDRVYLGSSVVWTSAGSSATVTIDNTGGAAKTDWPVLVTLSGADYPTGAATGGGDVHFKSGATELSYWIEGWTDDTSGSVWVKVPSIGGNSTAEITMHWGDGHTSTSSGVDVFTMFEGFDDPDSTLTGAPDVLGANVQVGNWNRDDTIVTADALVSWRQDDLRENSRIIYDPTDTTNPYKLYVTGNTGSDNRIGLFVSDDGHTWTEYESNPVFGTLDADDLQFVRVGSTIHAFVEYPGTPGATGIVVRRYTSADDGITWTNQGTVLDVGTAGAWDDERVGSPSVAPLSGGGYVMVFDGAGTGGGVGQEMGAATASTIDGTWTKIAGNPFLNTGASSVPTDFWQDENDVWWMFTWDDEKISLYKCEVADPTTWVSGDWVSVAAEFATIEGTLALAENSGRKSGVASRINNAVASNFVRRVDFLGTSTVTFGRPGITAPAPYLALIEAHSSELLLDPRGNTSGHATTARWDLSLLNDWAVGVKFKKQAQTNGSYARLSVGSGSTTAVDGNVQNQQPADSYGLIFGLEAQANTSLNSTSSGVSSAVGSAATVSDFPNYHQFELRHTGTTLSLTRDGTQIASGTASTHDATAKDVMVSQGRATSTAGAISTYDWIYVRKFDGVDPTVTVA